MKLAPNAIYGLHLTHFDGKNYIHLFHSNERGQADIALYADSLIKPAKALCVFLLNSSKPIRITRIIIGSKAITIGTWWPRMSLIPTN